VLDLAVLLCVQVCVIGLGDSKHKRCRGTKTISFSKTSHKHPLDYL
jgi:hypothetical protein